MASRDLRWQQESQGHAVVAFSSHFLSFFAFPHDSSTLVVSSLSIDADHHHHHHHRHRTRTAYAGPGSKTESRAPHLLSDLGIDFLPPPRSTTGSLLHDDVRDHGRKAAALVACDRHRRRCQCMCVCVRACQSPYYTPQARLLVSARRRHTTTTHRQPNALPAVQAKPDGACPDSSTFDHVS